MPSDDHSVGVGIARDRAEKPGPVDAEDEQLEKEAFPSAPSVKSKEDWVGRKWGPKPQVAGQINRKDKCRVIDLKMKILDLSVAADLAEWGVIRTTMDPENSPEYAINLAERKWCETKGTWLVYVEIAQLEYLQILSTEKPKDA